MSLAESSTPLKLEKAKLTRLIQIKNTNSFETKTPQKTPVLFRTSGVLLLEVGEIPMMASGDMNRSRRDYTTRKPVRQQKSKLLYITRHTKLDRVPALAAPSVFAQLSRSFGSSNSYEGTTNSK